MICANSNHMYPIDVPTFSSQNELDLHIQLETTKNNEIHPLCQYCKDRYYDKADLLSHISKQHVTCSICIRDSFIPKFFKDEKMLNDHLRKDHFACDESVCLEKGNVAFKSLFELQAHKRNVHSDVAINVNISSTSSKTNTTNNQLMGSLDNIFLSSASSILNNNTLNESTLPIPTNNPPATNYNDNYYLSMFSFNESRNESDKMDLPPLSRVSSNIPNDNFNTSLNSTINILGNDMMYDNNWNSTQLEKTFDNSSILGYSNIGITSNINNFDLSGNSVNPVQSQPTGSKLFNNIFDDDKSQFLNPNLSTFSISSLPVSRTPPPINQSDPLLSLGSSNPYAQSILGFNSSSDSNKLSSMPWIPLSQPSSFNYIDNTNNIDSFDLNKTTSNISLNDPIVGIPQLSKSISSSQQILDSNLENNLYPQNSGLWGSSSTLSPSSKMSTTVSPRLTIEENSILGSIDFNTSRTFGFLGRSLSDSNSTLTNNLSTSIGSNIIIENEPKKINSSVLSNSRSVSVPNNNNDDNDILSPSIFDLSIGTFSLNGRGGKLPPEFIPSNYNPSPPPAVNNAYSTPSSSAKQPYNNINSDISLSASSLSSLSATSNIFNNDSYLPSLASTNVTNNYSSTSDNWNDETSSNEGTSTFISSYDRALVPKALMDKLIEVLRRHPEGILGSQYPEAYRKIYNEKLVLETSNGRKLKLLNVLDGHPNVRKEKSGTWKWFYQESTGQNDPMDDLPTEFYPETMDDSTYKGDSGIEVDRLTADTFPSVAWLRDFNIHMYQWAGNAFEWTEYAMRLSPEIEYLFSGENHPDNISKLTNCNISIQTEKLYNKEEKFLVFVRGPNGHPSNANMSNALDYVSELIRNEFYENGLLTGDFNSQTIGLYSNNINDNRIQRILEIPQHNVGLIAGKGGKKLFAMRKKSGAYMSLVSKSKSNIPAKLTISGTQDSVDIAISLVRNALTEKDTSTLSSY